MKMKRHSFLMVATAIFCGSALNGYGAHPYRGLWVGQANLSYATEVSIPLDENNVAIAPDPEMPTPTADQAQIRLILHVNGAGQVNLLKDVAILLRDDSGATNQYYASETDYSLVTDESLYSEFSQQEARRIASAVFDFGDIKATEAVDAVVSQVCSTVALAVFNSADETEAQTRAERAAEPVVEHADVAESFDRFLKDNLARTQVDAVAVAADPGAEISLLQPEADTLYAQSFYRDSRAVDVLLALEDAIAGAASEDDKKAAAQNAVARFADVENKYGRFLRSAHFGDLIEVAAATAAERAANSGVTLAQIDDAVRLTDAYSIAVTDALNAKESAYDDAAAPDAVDAVVSRIVDAAYAAVDPALIVSELTAVLEAAGIQELSTLQQAEISVDVPSEDYTEFVRSDLFADAVSLAAKAAAEAAVDEAGLDPFHTQDTLRGAALIAATDALVTVYSSAARAQQNELPLFGSFEPGSGDARFVASISPTDAPLGSAGLSGTIVLPANHPTNPFRHRRHPDHTVGFNIERRLRFDFSGEGLETGSFGVDTIRGIYREEVFGLHKPLGPDPSENPIGLRVEGTFELNRISLIDTLNAR